MRFIALSHHEDTSHGVPVVSFDDQERTQNRLPSSPPSSGGSGALVQAEAACAHPPPQRVQAVEGRSLLGLGSPAMS